MDKLNDNLINSITIWLLPGIGLISYLLLHAYNKIPYLHDSLASAEKVRPVAQTEKIRRKVAKIRLLKLGIISVLAGASYFIININ